MNMVFTTEAHDQDPNLMINNQSTRRYINTHQDYSAAQNYNEESDQNEKRLIIQANSQLTEVREELGDESYPQTQRTGGTADLIKSKCNSVNQSMAKKNSSI